MIKAQHQQIRGLDSLWTLRQRKILTALARARIRRTADAFRVLVARTARDQAAVERAEHCAEFYVRLSRGETTARLLLERSHQQALTARLVASNHKLLELEHQQVSERAKLGDLNNARMRLLIKQQYVQTLLEREISGADGGLSQLD
jgi:hypothetical protein